MDMYNSWIQEAEQLEKLAKEKKNISRVTQVWNG